MASVFCFFTNKFGKILYLWYNEMMRNENFGIRHLVGQETENPMPENSKKAFSLYPIHPLMADINQVLED